jgi:hypothetical protein
MSCYDDSGDMDLYGPAPEIRPTAAPTVQPSVAENAVGEVLNVISSAGNPADLLVDVIPPNPADSKLPYGLAVVGACIVGMIWANSISKGK